MVSYFSKFTELVADRIVMLRAHLVETDLYASPIIQRKGSYLKWHLKSPSELRKSRCQRAQHTIPLLVYWNVGLISSITSITVCRIRDINFYLT